MVKISRTYIKMKRLKVYLSKSKICVNCSRFSVLKYFKSFTTRVAKNISSKVEIRKFPWFKTVSEWGNFVGRGIRWRFRHFPCGFSRTPAHPNFHPKNSSLSSISRLLKNKFVNIFIFFAIFLMIFFLPKCKLWLVNYKGNWWI